MPICQWSGCIREATARCDGGWNVGQVFACDEHAAMPGVLLVRRLGKPSPANLQLFVWKDFCPDYTSGIAFALAEDETQARELVKDGYGGDPYDWGTLEIRDLSPVGFGVSGGG